MFALVLLKRQWEIYWVSEESDDENNNSLNDSDWYDATIDRYNPKTNLFMVHFVGDSKNTAYEMELERSEVRASVSAWKLRR